MTPKQRFPTTHQQGDYDNNSNSSQITMSDETPFTKDLLNVSTRSQLSRAHNMKLEEWDQQESEDREAQLMAHIDALETNLEWVMTESKKKGDVLRDQVSALETNLEWIMADSKREEDLLKRKVASLDRKKDRLKDRVAKLEEESSSHKTCDSVSTLGEESLLPENDNKKESTEVLEKIKLQNQRLERYLSMVVEESTKREKHMKKRIEELESGAKLPARVNDLEIRLAASEKALAVERAKKTTATATPAVEAEAAAAAAAEATLDDQNTTTTTLLRKISDLEIELKKTSGLAATTEAEKQDLAKRCAELQKELDREREDTPHRNRIVEVSRDVIRDVPLSPRNSNQTLTNRIHELTRKLERTASAASSVKAKNKDLRDRISELEGGKERNINNNSNNTKIDNRSSVDKTDLGSIDRTEHSIDTTTGELKNLPRHPSTRVAETNWRETQLRERIRALESNDRANKRRNSVLRAKVSDLEQQLEQRRAAYEESQPDYEDSQRSVDDLEKSWSVVATNANSE